MATTLTGIRLPKELVEEIDAAAAETNLSTEVLLRAAVRRFLRSERRWRKLQEIGAERAQALGLETEDDVEAFLDALPD